MVHAMEEMLKEKEADEDGGEDGNDDDEELAVEEEIKIKRRCNKLIFH